MKTKPEPGDARTRALALLARREHTRAELARKLEAAGFVRDELQQLLDEFEAKNWLSDRRFAESWVTDHRAKSGSVKLAHELRQHGVPDAVIDEVLGSEEDGELERARGVAEEIWCPPRRCGGEGEADALPAKQGVYVRDHQARDKRITQRAVNMTHLFARQKKRDCRSSLFRKPDFLRPTLISMNCY